MRRFFAAMLAAAPVRLWALIGAAPVITALTIWFALLVRNNWPIDRAKQQLDYLGVGLIICVVLLGVIVVALAAVRLKAEVLGRAGFEIGGASADVPFPEPSKTTITATVESKPKEQ